LILKGALFVVVGLELPGKLLVRKKSGSPSAPLRVNKLPHSKTQLSTGPSISYTMEKSTGKNISL